MTRPVTATWTSACALLLGIALWVTEKYVSSEPGPHRSSLKQLGWEGKEDAPLSPLFHIHKAELKNT